MRFKLALPSILLGLLLTLPLASQAVEALQTGKGEFTFNDLAGNPGKPLNVWFYKPKDLAPDAMVVFVMHGVKRNGEDYRDQWVHHADRYHFLLVVPEFPKESYSNDTYQFGNVRDPDVRKWSFSAIEHLFDALRVHEPIHQASYFMYGHSAGAQFVHRFMLFMPQTRVQMAISANAGSYTMPSYSSDPEFQFPWSLDPKIVDEDQLKQVLGRHMTVMLGEDDVDPNHPALPRQPQAMAQGRFRFERGQHFFAAAKDQAQKLGVTLAWNLITVPHVAHSDTGMSEAAVKVLFPER